MMNAACLDVTRARIPVCEQVMTDRTQMAKDNYVCSDWLDEEKTKVLVTRVIPANMQNPTTLVNLQALEEKDWDNACAKHCNLHEEGLCVHVVAALENFRKNWRLYMKPWETLAGAKK